MRRTYAILWAGVGTVSLVLSACGGSSAVDIGERNGPDGGTGGAAGSGNSGTAGGTTTGHAGTSSTSSGPGSGGTTGAGGATTGAAGATTGAAGTTGASGSAGGKGGSAGAGNGGGAGGKPPQDSGVVDASDCGALRAEVQKTLAEAQKCIPSGAGVPVQCKDVLKGLCCDEPVNSKDSPEGMAYQQALDRYNAAHCATACPAVVCPVSMRTVCMPSSVSAGVCVFAP
jgi:hypothetical protein